MLLKHPWIFELVNSEWLLRLEKKNSNYGLEREGSEQSDTVAYGTGLFHFHTVGCVIGIRKL